MSIETVRAATIAADPPALDFVCREVVGACGSVFANFADKQIGNLAMTLVFDVRELQASTNDRAPLRDRITNTYKYGMKPLALLLGPVKKYGYETPQGKAAAWLYVSWNLLSRVEGCSDVAGVAQETEPIGGKV